MREQLVRMGQHARQPEPTVTTAQYFFSRASYSPDTLPHFRGAASPAPCSPPQQMDDGRSASGSQRCNAHPHAAAAAGAPEVLGGGA
jgi:hypothetical protein